MDTNTAAPYFVILACVAAWAVIGLFLWIFRKMLVGAFVEWLIASWGFYYSIPESYAVLIESGTKDGGSLCGAACSYGEFGLVKARGEKNWSINRIGDPLILPAYTDENGVTHPEEKRTCIKDDFHWDRRREWIKRIYGEKTGIIWVGWPNTVRLKKYNLRISNFRTVEPDEDEKLQKHATIRKYRTNQDYVNYPGVRPEDDKSNIAGYLISWNETTVKIGLFDDLYPIPVDGVRIGMVKGDTKEKKEQQGIPANILVFMNARIVNPALFAYRAEDALERITNAVIERVRLIVAGMSIEEVYSVKAELASKDAFTENVILKDGWGQYMEDHYGFRIKTASFAFVEPLGEAAKALSAPFVARLNAEATVIAGKAEGEAERDRLLAVNEAFVGLTEEQRENLAAMRTADVATSFADKGSNTVVLGFNPDNFLGGVFKRASEAVAPTPRPPVVPVVIAPEAPVAPKNAAGPLPEKPAPPTIEGETEDKK